MNTKLLYQLSKFLDTRGITMVDDNFPSPKEFEAWLTSQLFAGVSPGTSYNLCQCPLARFLNEKFNMPHRVGKGTASVIDPKLHILRPLPEWAMDFVDGIDTSGPERDVTAKECLAVLDKVVRFDAQRSLL